MKKSSRERDWYYKKTYNISLLEYDQMVTAQNGVCAICSKPERAELNGVIKRLAVDHCHVTGKIRGLLCNSCNGLLAKIGDSKEWLLAASKYLD